MTFSIIIPIYNAERYLRACLNSILAQTVEDWECVCVNDGSTDNSAYILNEYAVRDHRFYIVHQENAGVSAARNAGIDVVKGKYICFVDADDSLNPDFLRNYLAPINKYSPDIIRLNAFTNESFEGMKDGEEAWEWFWTRLVQNGYVWSFAVKSSIATKARFPAGVKCCEDSIYEMRLSPYIKTLYQLSTNSYMYREVSGSATHSQHSSENRLLVLMELLKIVDSGIRLHDTTFSRAVWGTIYIWLYNAADIKCDREIRVVYKKLASRGYAKIFQRYPLKMKILFWIYAKVGIVFPFLFISKIRRWRQSLKRYRLFR